MERSIAIAEMVEADLTRLAECWALARRRDEELPRLDSVLAQELGDAAERTFVIERVGPLKFRFGIASDRALLRLGFEVSGRELNENPPWPMNIKAILERATLARASAELMILAQTSLGEEVRVSVHLFPVADVSGKCSGFIGFVHAFGRSGETRDEFGIITHTAIAAAVLAQPEARGRYAHAAM
jgi:hypothetical protein